jgi:hypothetical protein
MIPQSQTNPLNLAPFDWDAPLDSESTKLILTKTADRIIARGLQAPMILFLETYRPLAPLSAQLGIALSPFIAIGLKDGAFDMQKYTQILRNPDNITELIRLIESKESPA